MFPLLPNPFAQIAPIQPTARNVGTVSGVDNMLPNNDPGLEQVVAAFLQSLMGGQSTQPMQSSQMEQVPQTPTAQMPGLEGFLSLLTKPQDTRKERLMHGLSRGAGFLALQPEGQHAAILQQQGQPFKSTQEPDVAEQAVRLAYIKQLIEQADPYRQTQQQHLLGNTPGQVKDRNLSREKIGYDVRKDERDFALKKQNTDSLIARRKALTDAATADATGIDVAIANKDMLKATEAYSRLVMKANQAFTDVQWLPEGSLEHQIALSNARELQNLLAGVKAKYPQLDNLTKQAPTQPSGVRIQEIRAK